MKTSSHVGGLKGINTTVCFEIKRDACESLSSYESSSSSILLPFPPETDCFFSEAVLDELDSEADIDTAVGTKDDIVLSAMTRKHTSPQALRNLSSVGVVFGPLLQTIPVEFTYVNQ